VVVGESHVLEGERSVRAGDVPGEGPDDGPRAALRAAVGRLRGELTAHRPLLPDRVVAEDELDALARQAETADRALGVADSERMRHSLLLVAAVLGSVSALAASLGALREAVESLAPSRR
jgi:Family of unknown function (DUF5955)